MNLFEDIKIEIQVLSSKIDELICRVEKIEESLDSNSSISPKIFEVIFEKIKKDAKDF
ncbi:MAG: hypothetical protein E6053_07360 [Finegoldia magna]|uniref:hypothetical protein n=1 Tax=Finegoldia magna TaxID=1260 RepID=UPI00290F7BAD|nr:hypothetical protein [Finegoldia magna]MDU5527268.1 hypothetical protein [Finegoldia magna]